MSCPWGESQSPPASVLTSIQSFKNLAFQNWGRTVSNTPAYTCVPNTAEDVCDIVKYAKKHRMGVRVSGFRKSASFGPRSVS